MSAAQQTPEPATAEDLLAVLRMIAERAGKEILRFYIEEPEIEVQRKEDDSPVTAADLAADKLILEMLTALTPDIPVVTEETYEEGASPDLSGGRFWLVDPLDGTKEFLSRNGEFTVNIALIEKGEPVAGVVHAPAMAMTWAGVCGPEGESLATFSETDGPVMPIEIRKAPQEGLTVVASRRHGQGGELDSFLGRFQVGQMVSAGSSLKFCLLANGKADLYPRFGRTMEWDTAAGHAVLRAAGGRVEDAEGRPLTYGKPGFENPHFIGYADC
jgi:3'(2'), 5'-bisphosphate nucleotidase